ncbi:hypothetical protein CF326_g3154 [Tilletia indica]|nr:hypothetical protein CF326_g3154 [Tilletia indica]
MASFTLYTCRLLSIDWELVLLFVADGGVSISTRIQHTRPHQDDSRASTAVKNSKNPRGVQRDPFIYPSNSHFIRAKRLVGNPPLDLSETS